MNTHLPAIIRALTTAFLFATVGPLEAAVRYTAPFGPGGTWNVYEPVDTPTTFGLANQASTQAVHSGVSGHLVTISSKAEDLAVGRMVGGDIWIGLTDQPQLGGMETGANPQLAKWGGWRGSADEIPLEVRDSVQPNGWVWVAGEPYAYQAWDTGEPNNFGSGEGGVRRRGSGFWSDDGIGVFGQSASTSSYLIEYETHSASPVPGTFQLDSLFPAAPLPGIEGGPGFAGMEVFRNGRSIDDGEAVIDSLAIGDLINPFFGSAPTINFHDPQSGGGGLFPSGRLTFPGNTAGDDDNFQFLIKGAIEVPAGQGGPWTFNVHGDDGFVFQIKGVEFTSAHGNGYIDFADRSTLAYPERTGDANTRGVVNLLPGVYPFQFVGFESSGGAFIELSAAPGVHPTDASTTQWQLVNSAASPLKFVNAPLPPVITQYVPPSFIVTQGNTATWTVEATGPGPLRYQWQREGVDIAGATNSTYSIPSVQPGLHEGVFRVIVSNAAGSTATFQRTLIVVPLPAVTYVTARGNPQKVYVHYNKSVLLDGVYTMVCSNTVNGTLAALVVTAQAYDGLNSNIVALSVSSDLLPDTNVYSVTILGVHDTAGLLLEPNPTVKTFLYDAQFAAFRPPWLRPAFAGNPSWDFNGNGVPDSVEIESGAVPDRNQNRIPDATEYSSVIQVLYPAVGVGVNKLTGDPTFPFGLNFLQAQDGLDLPNRSLFDSGYRVEGLLVPRKTGTYRFHIASDDHSELWLSTDAEPANKVLIATEPEWAAYREFTGNASGRRTPLVNNTLPNVSDGVFLHEGRLYYVDFLQKQGGGGNHFSVTVQEPGGPPVVNGQAPIGGGSIYPYMTKSTVDAINLEIGGRDKMSLLFDENPTEDIRVPEHRTITLTPMVTGSAPMEWTFTVNGVTHSTGQYPFSSNIQLGEAPTNLFLTINVSNLMGGQTRTLTIEAAEDVEPPRIESLGWSRSSHATLGDAILIGIHLDEFVRTQMSASNVVVRTASGQAVEILEVFESPDLPKNEIIDIWVPKNTDLTGGALFLPGIQDYSGNELPPTRLTLGGEREFQSHPIGLPLPTNPPVIDTGDTIEITAGGADVWGASDQCIFYSAPMTGDFDWKVRVDDMNAPNQDAKAGLMVRASTAANSASIFNCLKPWGETLDALFSGHGNNEIEAGVRRTTGGQTTSWATQFPPSASFAHRWLRLQRIGLLFRAFHSANGMDWKQHGETTVTMADQLLLGLFVVSHNVNFQAVARFSNFGPVGPTTVEMDKEKLRESGALSWSPEAGQAYVADNVTGPFRPLSGAINPFTLDASRDASFYKVGPRADLKGSISGTVTDPEGRPLTNLLVRVGSGHLQAPGSNGSFTFGRVSEGINELTFIKPVEVITETGQTIQTNITITVSVDVRGAQNVTVQVKVEIDIGPQPPPPCECRPWCGLAAMTINGVPTVVAGGGKIGKCNEEPQVAITGPTVVEVFRRNERRTYRPAANGVWTVTSTICGLTKRCQITP